ncbi:hypothetical protein B0H16DRAFT_1469527 [Mycena metata]|uniref:Uncharacterized protein n=1 Tax=Mycena metata TaxID=1033252 RepID=A0AAD7MSC5_9AGAR|nr:hypothetical protein B0H16DRAFT_1469527 [Mycena metata]
MSTPDPRRPLTIKLPASRPRPESNNSCDSPINTFGKRPAFAESEAPDVPGNTEVEEFIASKVRVVESRDSDVDRLRQQLKALTDEENQKQDLQETLQTLRTETEEYSNQLKRVNWYLQSVEADIQVAKAQNQHVRTRRTELQQNIRHGSEQQAQMQAHLDTLTAHTPLYLSRAVPEAGYFQRDEIIDSHSVLAAERLKLESELADQKSQLSSQAQREVNGEMAKYRTCVQEQVDAIFAAKTLEFQTAEATFQPQDQRDERASEWKRKIQALELDLRDALSREQCLRERHYPTSAGSATSTPHSVASSVYLPSTSHPSRHQARNSVLTQGIARLRAQHNPNSRERIMFNTTPLSSSTSRSSTALPSARFRDSGHQDGLRMPNVNGAQSSRRRTAPSGNHTQFNVFDPYSSVSGLTTDNLAHLANGAHRNQPYMTERIQQQHSVDYSPRHARTDFRYGELSSNASQLPAHHAFLTVTQKAVRELMQQLLGIEYDHNIGEAVRRGHCTALEFTAGDVEPSLTPFRPCWEDLKGDWNQTLAELFLDRFKLEHPDLSRNETYICDYFHKRLRTLRTALGIYGAESTADEVHDVMSSRGRRRQRRRAIFDKRLTWTADNGQSPSASNEPHPILRLYRMVKLLGTDGMSSESSDDDVPGLCTTVAKNWRHPDVVRFLEWIDLNCARHDAKRTTGINSHRRLRRTSPGRATASLRFPVAGLPLNFYHPVWLSGLTTGEKRRLGAREVVPLPMHLLDS